MFTNFKQLRHERLGHPAHKLEMLELEGDGRWYYCRSCKRRMWEQGKWGMLKLGRSRGPKIER